MTAVEDTFAVLLLAGAVITEAPSGMRGAAGLTFWFGRLTGAKASAADHPERFFQSANVSR